MKDTELKIIEDSIRTVPDFPKNGVQFRDISTLLSNPKAYYAAVRYMCVLSCKNTVFDKIAALESRGFLLGSPMSLQTEVPLVMIRKKGKLPGNVVSQEYQLEYGADSIEVTAESFQSGDRVLIVDDLAATGGTVLAACDLVEKCGAQVAGVVCLIDLPDLGGSKKISERYPFYSVLNFRGE